MLLQQIRKALFSHDQSHGANLIDNAKTCDRIAEENGVSKDTVIRASRFTKGVELTEPLIPGMREKILNKQVKVSKSDIRHCKTQGSLYHSGSRTPDEGAAR